MKGTLEFVIESARAVLASLAISHEVDTGFINAEEEYDSGDIIIQESFYKLY